MVNRVRTRSHPLTLLARAISAATQPTLTTIPMLLLLNATGSPRITFWQWLVWSCVTVTFSTTLPSLAFFVMLRRGIISDIYISERSERPLAYGLMIALAVIGTEIARLIGAPHRTILFLASGALCLVIAATVNARVFKISIHTMSAAYSTVALVMVFGQSQLPVLLLVPLVWWARVWLRAHTVWEATAGAIVGAAVSAAIFALL